MSNSKNTTKSTKTEIIDLPKMVNTATDAVELSAVRLMTCLRSINRLREIIMNESLQDPRMQEIFNATDEMELMIEKAKSVIGEFYDPAVEALVKTSQFLEAQFPNE